jgi:hypothetical protein
MAGMQECIWHFGEKARDHYENPRKGGRIILKWILNRHRMGWWTGLIWFMTGTSGRFF